MKLSRPLMIVCLAASLSGCTTWPRPSSIDGLLPAAGPLIPDTTLNIGPSISVALENVVVWGAYAGVAYLILDPLAPNWDIEQAAFPDAHYHLSLKMKRVYAGGGGEARVVFNQRAKDLMRQSGYDAYEVVEYTEGMMSSVLGSQRVTRGVIRLVRK